MSEPKVERLLLEAPDLGLSPAELPRAGVLVVGSDKKRAGFVVARAGVADAHCAIGRTKGGGWALKDLGAPGGTRLNGARIESARLGAGDEIAIGDVILRVVDPERPARRAPPPPSPADTQALDASELSPELRSTAAARGAPREPASAAQPEPARATPLPQIPGYRIERRLGRGGMGDVYLAVQESLDREVALKVLASKFESDREFVRRFQAEARAAAALNHPNVVTVYDVGESRGTHYLSMEYMDKGNLEDRAPKGTGLDVSVVLDILRDAATGLTYAEQRGIVHRDLKPANLMQNHVGQTKIADLGLATHVESEESETADKKVFGTPHFMSPEQARGERVDHRSDLYSLGATAYRLLTGHTPFEGQSAREIVRSLLRDEPKPMREYVPGLPDGVVGLVARLMQKDPAQRFASAAEVNREIERLRSPSFTSQAAPGTVEPARPRSRGGVGVLVLLAAAGGAGWWWWQRQAERAGGGNSVAPAGPDSRTSGLPAPDEASSTATGVPATGGSTAGSTAGTSRNVTTKEKDDKELQLLEANAKVALLELQGQSLSQNERRDALRSLAARYQGTSAATEALERADQITDEIVREQAAAEARKGQLDVVVARLREAAKLDDRPPHPGKSFLAMRAVDGQMELLGAPEFIVARKGVESAVSKTAVLYAEEILGAAKGDLERGDFDAAKKKLQDLLPLFDLPEFPASEAPAGVGELYDIGRRARERYYNLDAMKVQFATRRDREDALAFARELGGPEGLERELRRLDFDAAERRLAGLVQKLASPAAKAAANALVQDVAGARLALQTLARECVAGNWRRKSFVDPRDRKGTTRNAVSADATGIVYEVDGGGTDHVPWSAFGGKPAELSKLFLERCTREWSADEWVQITTLLKIAAVVEVLDLGSKMLDPTRKASFSESNARDMSECFTALAPWTQRATQCARDVARESEAAALFASVLRQTSESLWSTAVAGGERLLREYQDTLLVRLLSNGELPTDAPAPATEGPTGPDPSVPPVPREPEPPK